MGEGWGGVKDGEARERTSQVGVAEAAMSGKK